MNTLQWIIIMALPANKLLTIADISKLWKCTKKTTLTRLREMGIEPFALSYFVAKSGNQKGMKVPGKRYVSCAQLQARRPDDYQDKLDATEINE